MTQFGWWLVERQLRFSPRRRQAVALLNLIHTGSAVGTMANAPQDCLVARIAFLCTTICTTVGGVLPSQPDYLREADPVTMFPTSLSDGPGLSEMTLSNGLISRTFTRIDGGFATTALKLEAGDGTHFTRGVSPEARVVLDGGLTVDVGGLTGQQQYLLYYPDETMLSPNPMAMAYLNHTVSSVVTEYVKLLHSVVNSFYFHCSHLHTGHSIGTPASA
jgi:hypothetical protein